MWSISLQFSQPDYYEKGENSSLNKGSELAFSIQHVGGTIKNAVEVSSMKLLAASIQF